jgi:hypothetical protein
MNISAYTGETVKIQTTVLDVDGNAADLTGAIARFSFSLVDGTGEVVSKDCTVTDNVLSITLEPADTQHEGWYFYEFRILLNGEEDMVQRGRMNLIKSVATLDELINYNNTTNYDTLLALVDGQASRITDLELSETDHEERITELEADKFDDLFFPLAQVRVGANSLPHFDYTNNGLLFPQNDTSEYVLITCQLPHRWKEGSTVYPHLHYMQTQDVQPTFRMEYRWTNIGDAISGTWTNYDLNQNAIPYESGVHQILKASAGIVGTGKTISSLLEIKLYRTDNVHTGDLLAKQFDVHIEIDSLGSTLEYTK